MKIIQLQFLLGMVIAQHDYFEYDDCGETCTSQRTSCTIAEGDSGNFITTCCSSEDCLAHESNLVVCLRPGQAPSGGSDLWSMYQPRVHPSTTTSKPETSDDCKRWKIMLISGWALSGLSLIFYVAIFVKRRISRVNFEQLVNEDNPYQPTVHDVNPE